ncbi:OLC1v1031700C1 [Oldenlandia corymbosa var. corymbosa]|uniref:OLC1v1031700C1 n=1 Tax=Oldenlandia corymbosa var. corymbosa TaxID=529605 RepID=A0AAV1CJ17_OLDCO|nr:OLC1v1031700C1 [Oldenlandia corymbosa var. corymbosa]
MLMINTSDMGLMVHIISLMCVLISVQFLATSASLKTYIIHVESPNQFDGSTQFSTTSSVSNEDLDSWYLSFMPKRPIMEASSSSTKEAPRLIYSYHNILTGFAAKLSAEDVKSMEKKAGFISATPQKILPLHTTHTPNFLGLYQNTGFWKDSNFGKGVIIGMLDTGIMPDHPSFSDDGMPPPPAKWKGKCEFDTSVCNNKLIGARFFQVTDGETGDGAPIDTNGHGTHTASTAAGNYVAGANVFDNANGTAVGVAPLAHLAIYRVCGGYGCSESAILAAMDVAIDDGVDILSLSLGGRSKAFSVDSIAIGAFRAMERGILVSCSAGNRGPMDGSTTNEAPWILTVGASTIDRKIGSTAVLGNNVQLDGESLYQPKDFPSIQYPIYFPGVNQDESDVDRFCSEFSTNVTEVKGKIVVCEVGVIRNTEKGSNVKAAGGVGMIIFNSEEYGYSTRAETHVLPTVHITYADRKKLIAYVNSTSSPMAAISFKGTIIGDEHAPQVAYFSSRGPSQASPGILKPDIIGPGVNILAAWYKSVENITNTKSTFNVISGTSMSCPHLSGVAALLKSAHPDWSPAAIKSAIMTTADLVNIAKNPIEDERQLPADVFAIGSGHVNPSRANKPGLIYDISPKDYIPYLCGLNYSNKDIGVIVGRKVKCSKKYSITESQLNYPSFAILFGSSVQKYTRTLTNVGEANSVYTAKVDALEGVKITVNPNTLKFSKINQKLTYEITFTKLSSTSTNTRMSQGSVAWISSKYIVRSPIAAIFGSVSRVTGT